MKIHGVILSRDDWGPLPLSICHALINHVDVVHVVDHGSVDQTASGLQILKDIWGDRLMVYSTGLGVPFKQSLLTNMIVSFAEAQGADWIYVFDADEFLLAKPGFNLKRELSKLDENVVSVRYSLNNYISTFDFNRLNTHCYRDLRYKSQPKHDYDSTFGWDAIEKEQATFFDFPFPPKVIFRTRKNLLVNDGAHGLFWLLHGQVGVHMPIIECAHVTYISRDILERKKILGEALIRLGLPRKHGWQSQLIFKLHQEGRLDSFWERHSIKIGGSTASNPIHIIEETLAANLEKSIALLEQAFGGNDLTIRGGQLLERGPAAATAFSFAQTFQMMEHLFERTQQLYSSRSQSKRQSSGHRALT